MIPPPLSLPLPILQALEQSLQATQQLVAAAAVQQQMLLNQHQQQEQAQHAVVDAAIMQQQQAQHAVVDAAIMQQQQAQQAVVDAAIMQQQRMQQLQLHPAPQQAVQQVQLLQGISTQQLPSLTYPLAMFQLPAAAPSAQQQQPPLLPVLRPAGSSEPFFPQHAQQPALPPQHLKPLAQPLAPLSDFAPGVQFHVVHGGLPDNLHHPHHPPQQQQQQQQQQQLDEGASTEGVSPGTGHKRERSLASDHPPFGDPSTSPAVKAVKVVAEGPGSSGGGGAGSTAVDVIAAVHAMDARLPGGSGEVEGWQGSGEVALSRVWLRPATSGVGDGGGSAAGSPAKSPPATSGQTFAGQQSGAVSITATRAEVPAEEEDAEEDDAEEEDAASPRCRAGAAPAPPDAAVATPTRTTTSYASGLSRSPTDTDVAYQQGLPASGRRRLRCVHLPACCFLQSHSFVRDEVCQVLRNETHCRAASNGALARIRP